MPLAYIEQAGRVGGREGEGGGDANAHTTNKYTHSQITHAFLLFGLHLAHNLL
jgi:hypothetical protein